MSLEKLGYYNNKTNHLNPYEFVKVSYIDMLMKKEYQQILNIKYIETQVSILETLIKKHVIKKFNKKYMSKNYWISVYSLFNIEFDYYNDKMFNYIRKDMDNSVFKNKNTSDLFLFLMYDYHISDLNLENIQHKHSVASYFNSMSFLKPNPESISYVHKDISNNFILMDLEKEFKDYYINFKSQFSAYIVMLYTFFSALKINGQSNLIESTYIDIINESKKGYTEKSFYIKNLDLYNPSYAIDILCENDNFDSLKNFVSDTFKHNGFKHSFLGIKFNYPKSCFLNIKDRINLNNSFYENFAI